MGIEVRSKLSIFDVISLVAYSDAHLQQKAGYMLESYFYAHFAIYMRLACMT